MKRIATLAVLASSVTALISCSSPPPPAPVHVHHYHSTTTRTKSASVSGYKSSPEGFQAVTPPSSYSQ